MSELLCACGHPRHSIPCPDTSGDDGEGHVTICGCHRFVSEKLATLPPRPKWEILRDDTVEADRRMDAQDILIAELEAEAKVKDERMACMYLEAVRTAKKVADLERERDHPETEDFFKGVPLEAAHQRARWGSEHDSGKAPADWFWLVGYLAGKCLAAHIGGGREKALHHTISTAASLANWHMAIKGAGNMRPGIEDPLVHAAERELQI